MRISDWSSDVCSSDDPVLRGAQVGLLVLFGRQLLALWRDVTAIGLLARFTGLVLVVVAMLERNGVHVYLSHAARDRYQLCVDTIRTVLLDALPMVPPPRKGEINSSCVRQEV